MTTEHPAELAAMAAGIMRRGFVKFAVPAPWNPNQAYVVKGFAEPLYSGGEPSGGAVVILRKDNEPDGPLYLAHVNSLRPIKPTLTPIEDWTAVSSAIARDKGSYLRRRLANGSVLTIRETDAGFEWAHRGPSRINGQLAKLASGIATTPARAMGYAEQSAGFHVERSADELADGEHQQ